VHADLADYDNGTQQWDAIISIFCHLPPDLRQDVILGNSNDLTFYSVAC